jgi:hypothetical protein
MRIARQQPEIPPLHRLLNLWDKAYPYIVQCRDPNAPVRINVRANLAEFE